MKKLPKNSWITSCKKYWNILVAFECISKEAVKTFLKDRQWEASQAVYQENLNYLPKKKPWIIPWKYWGTYAGAG